jgi:hypothetical protein
MEQRSEAATAAAREVRRTSMLDPSDGVRVIF